MTGIRGVLMEPNYFHAQLPSNELAEIIDRKFTILRNGFVTSNPGIFELDKWNLMHDLLSKELSDVEIGKAFLTLLFETTYFEDNQETKYVSLIHFTNELYKIAINNRSKSIRYSRFPKNV